MTDFEFVWSFSSVGVALPGIPSLVVSTAGTGLREVLTKTSPEVLASECVLRVSVVKTLGSASMTDEGSASSDVFGSVLRACGELCWWSRLRQAVR